MHSHIVFTLNRFYYETTSHRLDVMISGKAYQESITEAIHGKQTVVYETEKCEVIFFIHILFYHLLFPCSNGL